MLAKKQNYSLSNKSGSTRNQMTLDLSHSPSLLATFMKKRLKMHDEVASLECITLIVQNLTASWRFDGVSQTTKTPKFAEPPNLNMKNLSSGLVLSHRYSLSHKEKQMIHTHNYLSIVTNTNCSLGN